MHASEFIDLAARGAGAGRLSLRAKRPARVLGAAPLLLLHGAMLNSGLFDLPRPGYSLMEDLAGAGIAVYALDSRGYGRSLGWAAMERPAGEAAPFGGVDAAVEDVAAAVEFIHDREGVSCVDLAGFSWGSIIAARYAGEHPDIVSRLALYAPLYAERNDAWLARIADARDPRRLDPEWGAYRLVTRAQVIERWDAELGSADPAPYRDERTPDLIFEVLSASDPAAERQKPKAFRCPNGALEDMVTVFNGVPLFDPAKLTMQTLLVRGDRDVTSTDSDATALWSRIASPDKEYRVIAGASHFLCVEHKRSELYEALNRFFVPREESARSRTSE